MTKFKMYKLHEGVIYFGRFPSNLDMRSAIKSGWYIPETFKKLYPQFAHNYKDIAVEIKVPPLKAADNTEA